jgi:hypothetical protein
MTDDPINTILLRDTKPRQSAQPDAMTGDPINMMLAMLRSQLERRENERQKPGASQMVPPEEQFERRLERLLDDPIASVREIEDFHDELRNALFASGGRKVPDDVGRALEAKIANAQATVHGVNANRPKNKGGAPIQYDWDAFWCHIVIIANTPDGLPERNELYRTMMDWWNDRLGDNAPANSTVRDKLSMLYAALR